MGVTNGLTGGVGLTCVVGLTDGLTGGVGLIDGVSLTGAVALYWKCLELFFEATNSDKPT